MFNIGGSELVLISVLALLLVPPEKLPQVATTLGRFLAQLQAGIRDVKSQVHSTFREDLPTIQRRTPPALPAEKKETPTAPTKPV